MASRYDLPDADLQKLMDSRFEYDEWIESRPQVIQELARRFPPGSVIHGDKHLWVVGYCETDTNPGLYVSETNPAVDYDKAVETKQFVCADHL